MKEKTIEDIERDSCSFSDLCGGELANDKSQNDGFYIGAAAKKTESSEINNNNVTRCVEIFASELQKNGIVVNGNEIDRNNPGKIVRLYDDDEMEGFGDVVYEIELDEK